MARSRLRTRTGWPRARRLLFGAAAALAAASVAGCDARSAKQPSLHQVTIESLQFDPPQLSIAAGDTVEWVNRDLVPHTATAAGGGWDSDTIAAGGAWRTVLVEPGEESYSCLIHPAMKGRIEVR